MSSDSGGRLARQRSVRFRLPTLVEVEVRGSALAPPKLRNFKSALVRRRDTVDILIRTDRPIPSRALGPALFVGSTVLTEVHEVGPNSYRFTNYGRQTLEDNAEIRLGWTGQAPTQAVASNFRFHGREPRTSASEEGDESNRG